MHNTYHIKYTGQKEITTLKIPPALLTGGIYFLWFILSHYLKFSSFYSPAAILFPILDKSWTTLDFLFFSCYTNTRYQTRKTKVLQGFRRFPAQNESCVRDLPHVKQNFITHNFIMIYHCLKSLEIQRFLGFSFMS